MKGYQISFFTQEDRRHPNGQPLSQWLLDAIRHLGLRGATLSNAQAGIGHDGRVHSSHFFELTDQPRVIVLTVDDEESSRLFEFLTKQPIHLFYTRTPVEFGTLGTGN